MREKNCFVFEALYTEKKSPRAIFRLVFVQNHSTREHFRPFPPFLFLTVAASAKREEKKRKIPSPNPHPSAVLYICAGKLNRLPPSRIRNIKKPILTWEKKEEARSSIIRQKRKKNPPLFWGGKHNAFAPKKKYQKKAFFLHFFSLYLVPKSWRRRNLGRRIFIFFCLGKMGAVDLLCNIWEGRGRAFSLVLFGERFWKIFPFPSSHVRYC